MDDHWKEDSGSWVGGSDGGRPPRWKFWSSWSKKRRIVVGSLVLLLLLLAIIIPVAVVASKKSSDSDSDSDSSSSSGPSNSNLDGISRDSIPVSHYQKAVTINADFNSGLCEGNRVGSILVV